MSDFSVAFFSDPPVASWVLPELFRSDFPIACVVTALPRMARHDFVDDLQKDVEARNIPFFRTPTLAEPGFLEAFLKTRPALAASMSFLRKIPGEILSRLPLGGINCHPALLPRHRGAVPYFWTLYNQETETGVTLHEMTDTFDAGDIHLSRKIQVEPEETTGSLAVKCATVGIALLLEAFAELRQGRKLPRVPQDHTRVTYAPIPDSSVLEIPWSVKGEKIVALIRAASPFFGAYTLFRNLVLKIWSARLSRPNAERVKPGTLVVSRGKAEVACADAFVSLEVVQLEVFRYYSGEEFRVLLGIRDGERLGRPSVQPGEEVPAQKGT